MSRRERIERQRRSLAAIIQAPRTVVSTHVPWAAHTVAETSSRRREFDNDDPNNTCHTSRRPAFLEHSQEWRDGEEETDDGWLVDFDSAEESSQPPPNTDAFAALNAKITSLDRTLQLAVAVWTACNGNLSKRINHLEAAQGELRAQLRTEAMSAQSEASPMSTASSLACRNEFTCTTAAAEELVATDDEISSPCPTLPTWIALGRESDDDSEVDNEDILDVTVATRHEASESASRKEPNKAFSSDSGGQEAAVITCTAAEVPRISLAMFPTVAESRRVPATASTSPPLKPITPALPVARESFAPLSAPAPPTPTLSQTPTPVSTPITSIPLLIIPPPPKSDSPSLTQPTASIVEGLDFDALLDRFLATHVRHRDGARLVTTDMRAALNEFAHATTGHDDYFSAQRVPAMLERRGVERRRANRGHYYADIALK
jgi:hypothetical protein